MMENIYQDINKITSFFDSFITYENLKKTKTFDEYEFLPYIVSLFSPNIITFSSKRKENINNYFSDIFNFIKKNDFVRKLYKNIIWANISYWCLLTGRRPLIASVKDQEKIEDFKHIWKIYKKNTDWLKNINLFTLNEFICTFSKSKKKLIINFSKANEAISFFSNTLTIPVNKINNFLPQNLHLKENEYFNNLYKVKLKDKNSVIRFFSYFDSKDTYDFKWKTKELKVIIQNISLWYYKFKNINYLYFFPISLDNILFTHKYLDIKAETPTSIVAIATEHKLTDNEEFIIDLILRNIFNKILLLNLSKVIRFKDLKQKENATNSAVSSIMSRNMSHNIGSHVLSYVRNQLSSTSEMIKNGAFEELLHHLYHRDLDEIINDLNLELPEAKIIELKEKLIHSNPDKKFNNIDLIKKILPNISDSDIEKIALSIPKNAPPDSYPNAKYLLGISKLLSYIQERQDYIATITSEGESFYSTVNFKDFIFDEFIHDYKAIRHRKSYELTLNHLLDNIARSEGFDREDIIIKFRNFNGLNEPNIIQWEDYNTIRELWNLYKENFQDNRKEEDYYKGKEPPFIEQENEHPDLSYMRKIRLDVPDGILGRQAFFSILENIIRNAAKHGKRNRILTFNSFLELTRDEKLPKVVEKFLEAKGELKDLKDRWEIEEKISEYVDKILASIKDFYNIPFVGDEYNSFEKEIKNKLSTALEISSDSEELKEYYELIEKAAKNLEITINIEDIKEDDTEIKDLEKRTDLDDKEKEKYKREILELYYRITITDNNHNAEPEVIKKLNTGLNDEIIDETGKLKEEYKGLKEIKISAGWLRRIEPYRLQEDHILPIVKVRPDTHPSGKPNIQYVFYMRKPQIVALITNDIDLKEYINNPKNKEFEGWRVFTKDEITSEDIGSYDFVLIDKDLKHIGKNDKELKHIGKNDIKYRPVRVLEKYNLDPIKKEVKKATPNSDKLLSEIYFNWLKENFKEEEFDEGNPLIVITDIQAYHKYHNINHNRLILDNSFTKKTLSVKKDIENKKLIIFKTHNDTQEEFYSFERDFKEIFERAEFIEGISGGNSTDRLIRRELEFIINNNYKIDVWIYKLIESALTRVIIFDERLWDKYRKAGMKKILEKKNIYIYTIDHNAEPKSDSDKDKIKNKNSAERKIPVLDLDGKPVAYIINGEFESKLGKEQKPFADNKKIHFALYHKGLLDKIYPEDTNELKQFDSLRKYIGAKYDIIHSGRGRQGKLPNNVTFLQYASLENTLADCKFSLTELLYSLVFKND